MNLVTSSLSLHALPNLGMFHGRSEKLQELSYGKSSYRLTKTNVHKISNISVNKLENMSTLSQAENPALILIQLINLSKANTEASIQGASKKTPLKSAVPTKRK